MPVNRRALRVFVDALEVSCRRMLTFVAVVPEATPIVDIYHAREHLHDLAAGLAPVLGDGHDDWLHARLADLDAGDIEALVTETTRLPLDGDTAKALAYFKTNAQGMRYAYFREHGMFIGSGTVSRLQSRRWSTTRNVRHALEHPRRHRHPHPPMRTSQQPLRAHLDTADSGHRGPRIDCGAGHHAVMPHHRRMAFGYGTSVPTRGLGAVIASRNGVGRVEGRRAEAKWLAAAVGTGLLYSAAVS